MRLNERLQTIKDTCDLVQQIKHSQATSQTEEAELLLELDTLIDRLCLCDIPNLPVLLNLNTIQSWVEQHAKEQITHLEDCLNIIAKQEKQKERTRKRDLFMNPRTRGKWLDMHFKTSSPMMPNYAIDGNGQIFREPTEVKRTYLTEGTLFIRKRLDPPDSEEEDKKFEKPLDFKERKKEVRLEEKTGQKRSPRPKWWDRLYNRNAKSVSDNTC